MTEIPHCIGIDGCRAGWVIASDGNEGSIAFHLIPSLEKLDAELAIGSMVAIDMPIGLPDRIEGTGREAEKAVRPLLGERQSSVFSIPAREVVYQGDYQAACELSLKLSDPPRRIAKQAFHLFPKIRELDRLLRGKPRGRYFEVHPEFAFFQLNGGKPLATPKKVKSRINPDGMRERIALLCAAGLQVPHRWEQLPKIKGAGSDDILDACACLAIAHRLRDGTASPYPSPPGRDRHDLPIAIWG